MRFAQGPQGQVSRHAWTGFDMNRSRVSSGYGYSPSSLKEVKEHAQAVFSVARSYSNRTHQEADLKPESR
jgi:hypothetical protein